MPFYVGVVLGFLLGVCVVQGHHDSLWGRFNHAQGRTWSWRPKFYEHLGNAKSNEEDS